MNQSTFAFAFALVALASTDAGAEESSDYEGETIIVTGKSDGYRQIESTSGTKTSIPLLNIPQSISVVTGEQLSDQQIRSVSDLARHVPGLSAGQGEGHRDQVTFRGNNSTADFFVDGLRDDVQHFRSFYNVDRVEVHKGPNAMIFGRGGGGGLLNRVTKGAVANQLFSTATGSVDSFGSAYGAADVNTPIGAGAAIRINGFYERLDNHRDAYDGDRYAINPVVGGQLGLTTKLEIGYEFVRDDRVIDRGVPSTFVGSIANPAGPLLGSRDAFFGVRGVNSSKFEGHSVRLRFETELTSTLKLTSQTVYGDYDKVYSNIFAASGAKGTAGAPTVGIEAYRDPTRRQNFVAQSNLIWSANTGDVGHTFLFGTEYTDQDSYNERINGFFDPLVLNAASRRRDVALIDPITVPPVSFIAGPTGNSNRANDSRLKQVSAYVQDQIVLGDHVDIIVGIRYDRFDIDITNRFTQGVTARVDNLWSPRAGLVIKPSPQSSLYVGYSKSFLPQAGDQFLSLDATGATLRPETFDNYEIGAKWDIQADLTATIALFRLDRGNTRAPGALPGAIVQSGEQRSSGYEIGLTGRITPKWQIALGYADTKAEIRTTTSAAPAGRKIGQVPKHQLSVWNRFDPSERLGLGIGIYSQSGQFTTISNATRLPGYTRVDAAVFFKINERIETQFNIENITNTRYFPVAHNDNNISTGAPINARFTIKASF